MKAYVEKGGITIAINEKGEGILKITDTNFGITPMDIPHIAEGIARSIEDDEEYSFIRNSGRFLKIYPGETYIHFTNGERDEYVSRKDAKMIFDFCIGYIGSLPSAIVAEIKTIKWRYVKLIF